MEESNKAEIIFHIGMYVFMLTTAGIIGYEFLKISKIFLHVILVH